MIINNNFNVGKNNFTSSKPSSLQEQKKALQNSIDNLDKRFKNGEIDLDKFKKIASGYAVQQEKLNQQMRNNNR